ncbi:branched-chain amino acid aminotransferase [Alkalihalobacillus sp. MEB130]|uniref:branched-chain amino acid aminotransferase n=1 Tax=Alkalihalobacillus sp. MEB130 TaxID=2976704 RepID=UPI0028E03B42|nr:branched-chain amino acid aminotransferase [Alkalihalobacillus sp. MEB130]MDT8860665.1 branched-chain amino acid aminotransferase [Alkalihalobacillus sp. MEB130]
MTNLTVSFKESSTKKQKPNADKIAFGKHFTDHMFVMDYEEGKGWYDPRIVPYEPITLDPAAMIFHYGQTVFEGLKAYRTPDDRILLFRPEKNFQRLNLSSDRLSIPEMDEDVALRCLHQLLEVEKEWVPKAEGNSLYIRPFIVATEPNLSLAPSRTYQFMMILSPVGSYYKEGIQPVRIHVEDEYTRAVRGGTGKAKTAGNYAAAYKAQERATKEGYSQVLWLDGVEKKYIEEVGSMNVFFKVKGEVITPELNGSILEGITRMSIIELLKDWGVPVLERKISLEELYEAYDQGELEEAFGTGTAAVISPVGELNWGDRNIVINNGEIGELSKRLYDTLTGIQTGKIEDPYDWTVEVK